MTALVVGEGQSRIERVAAGGHSSLTAEDSMASECNLTACFIG